MWTFIQQIDMTFHIICILKYILLGVRSGFAARMRIATALWGNGRPLPEDAGKNTLFPQAEDSVGLGIASQGKEASHPVQRSLSILDPSPET